ncbi:MAG: hypothetical protein C0478_16510 [Planctomyces sp.]|nr:hypothetical protein [Planctomyces sp.]
MPLRSTLHRLLLVSAALALLVGGVHAAQLIMGTAQRDLGNYTLTALPFGLMFVFLAAAWWMRPVRVPSPIPDDAAPADPFAAVVGALDTLHRFFPETSPPQGLLLQLAEAAMSQRYAAPPMVVARRQRKPAARTSSHR